MFKGIDSGSIIKNLQLFGGWFVFGSMFLEHLNVPGLPASIILTAVGVIVAQGTLGLWTAIWLSVIAGILGSIVLYVFGFYVGEPVIRYLCKKSKKADNIICKMLEKYEKHGNKSSLYIRFIPVARTLISLIAGTSRLKFVPFVVYSSFGIFIWNVIFIIIGYLFGNQIL